MTGCVMLWKVSRRLIIVSSLSSARPLVSARFISRAFIVSSDTSNKMTLSTGATYNGSSVTFVSCDSIHFWVHNVNMYNSSHLGVYSVAWLCQLSIVSCTACSVPPVQSAALVPVLWGSRQWGILCLSPPSSTFPLWAKLTRLPTTVQCLSLYSTTKL